MSFIRVGHALFLVLGTAIGGGILALPLVVAENGFLPAAIAMLVCFLFMGITADFHIQANLWGPRGTHLIGTSRALLGSAGARLVWFLYCFIGYASPIAYLAGVSQVLGPLLPEILQMPLWLLELVVLVVLGSILASGAHVLAKCNSLFVILMLLILGAVLVAGFSQATLHPFAYSSLSGLGYALPLFLASFSFQMIVPSLRSYLGNDPRPLRVACWGGLALAAALYIAWLGMMFSLIPVDGPHGLKEAAALAQPITTTLTHWIQAPWLNGLITFFSLFALTTSFLGISLGLYEFLLDGLRTLHTHWSATRRKLFILGAVLVPVILGCWSFEDVFLKALDLTGGLGDSTLNGLIPIAMVFVGFRRVLEPQVLRRPIMRGVVCALFASAVILIEFQRIFFS
ncbi:MAG: aromatic amino acid transport family protein [Chlamydiia bacterium]